MALAISSTPSKWLWVTNRLSSLGYSCLPLAIRDFLEPSDPVVKCRRKHGYVKACKCLCLYVHPPNELLTTHSQIAISVQGLAKCTGLLYRDLLTEGVEETKHFSFIEAFNQGQSQTQRVRDDASEGGTNGVFKPPLLSTS